MLGKMQPYGNIPFFWTRHYDKSIQVIGCATEFDDVFITGDLAGHKFLAYYFSKGRVVQVAAMGLSSDILTWMEAMNQNVMPSAEEIRSGTETPQTILRKLKQAKGQGGCRREHCCKKKNIAP